eukprot:TRINITY_DN54813_c0_g1_i1.p1 TRINITY_DN54813_c0_g1~~TRINITY_DN54813_c0_g1_i1.p1  ORF type:complete len:430 (+),score=69.70 TRINITY_DN54813_c0_g1_i1:69-1358(+)
MPEFMDGGANWHAALEQLMFEDPTLDSGDYHAGLRDRFPDLTKQQVKNRVKRLRAKQPVAEEETEPAMPRSEAAVTGPGFLFYGDPLSDHGRSDARVPVEDCVLPVSAYEVRDSPCGGSGVFATRPILSGDFIVLEKPIISVRMAGPSGESKLESVQRNIPIVQPEFDKLSPEDRAVVLELTDFCSDFDPKIADATPTGIFLTNAIPGSDGEYGLCCKIARFNHSCAPNAFYNYDEERGENYVRAQRNIEAGEEICVHYFAFEPAFAGIKSAPVLFPAKKRKELLKKSFGTACACRVCSADDAAVAESDRQRKEILKAVHTLNNPTEFMPNPNHLFWVEATAYNALELVQKEGVEFPSLVREFAEIGQTVCKQSKKHPRRPFWTKTMYEIFRFCFGEKGVAAPGLKALAREAAADAKEDKTKKQNKAKK